MNDKQKFTLGFIFDSKLEKVLLMKKLYCPKGLEKMLNSLNGIGGKLETNEDCFYGMYRECLEETGLKIPPDKWVNFCNLDAKFGYVYCFYAIIKDFVEFKEWPGGYKNFYVSECIYQQMEDEELGDYWIEKDFDKNRYGDYRDLPHMENLKWLIPMALNNAKKIDACQCFEIKENY